MESPDSASSSPPEYTLIQCDKCLKWRSIPTEQAKLIGLDTQWFCILNPDRGYASCNIPEQKHTLPRGMKYVYSLLPLGELVIARLTGHPIWPAVLSPDPVSGDYYDCLLEKPDEPTYYHVEFLGRPRSHAWVTPPSVETFNMSKLRERLETLPCSKQAHLNHALEEAKSFMKLSQAQRIDGCIFKYNESLSADKENFFSGNLSIVHENTAPKHQPWDVLHEVDCVPRKRGRKRKRVEVNCKGSQCSDTDEEVIKRLNRKRQVHQTSKEPEQPKQVSLVEESTFLCSYREHLQALGCSVPKPPRWRGKTANIFSLYKLIMSKGGYHQVCKDRGWSLVYQLLTPDDDRQPVIDTRMGSCVKSFYAKSLLSYEMVSTTRNELGEGSSDVDQTREEAFVCPVLNEMVPSSNPDSPQVPDDSPDDSDLLSLEAECQKTLTDILQIERNLTSQESDSSETQDLSSSELEARLDSCSRLSLEMSSQSTSQLSLPLNHDPDIMDALQEIGKIEDAIADLERSLGLNF